MSDARGLDTLLSLETENSVIVPNKDVKVENYDKITCRIIKFGKKNAREWKGNDTSPPSTSLNLRIYLYVYEFFQASKGGINTECTNTIITINPKVQWLGNLIAEQTKLADLTQDKEEIFRRKFVLRRNDKKITDSTNTRGNLEVTDLGRDENYSETQHSRVQNVDEDDIAGKDATKQVVPQVNQTEHKETVKPQTQTTQTQVTQKNEQKPAADANISAATAVLTAAKTPEAAQEGIKTIYNSISKETPEGKELRAKVMTLYKNRKCEIIKEMVTASGKDFGATGEALCAKYYPKPDVDKLDIDAVKAHAIELASKVKPESSDDLEEDDVPF